MGYTGKFRRDDTLWSFAKREGPKGFAKELAKEIKDTRKEDKALRAKGGKKR